MTTKTSKKMKSFMCHSTSATAVCTVSDSRSVIVPRKSDTSSTTIIDNPSSSRLKMMTTVKYSRLVDSPGLLPPNTNRYSSSSIKKEESKNQANYRPKPPLLSSSSDQVFQVVVMRVSLHCQGCAGKVKKHLSKMEGVTSFSIDLETKRVTVMGHVSPIGVLESISKVKRAEFWPSS